MVRRCSQDQDEHRYKTQESSKDIRRRTETLENPIHKTQEHWTGRRLTLKWENREYCQRKHGTSWAIVQDQRERERVLSAAHIETELIDETETIWFHGIHCQNKGNIVFHHCHAWMVMMVIKL